MELVIKTGVISPPLFPEVMDGSKDQAQDTGIQDNLSGLLLPHLLELPTESMLVQAIVHIQPALEVISITCSQTMEMTATSEQM